MSGRHAAAAAAATALLSWAPAATAFPGAPAVAQALRGPAPLLVAPKAPGRTGHLTSCHADDRFLLPRSARPGALERLGRKVAPVACEQPPRSQFFSVQALRHAALTALAGLG